MNKTFIRSKRKHDFKRAGLSWVFIFPFIAFFIIFTALPLVLGIGLSFFDYNPHNPETIKFVGLLNYVDMFGSTNESINLTFVKPFWDSLVKTLLFNVVIVPLLIVVPLALAYLINFRPPGYKIFRAIIFMPSIVSITVAGMMFTAIFAEDSTGIINSMFGTNVKFLTEENWRWFIIVLLSIWWQTGTNFVIFSSGLRDVPKNLYEACEVDGGGKRASFFKVTLPNIKGQINLCLFTTIINYLNLFGQPKVIRSGSIYNTQYDSPMMLIQGTLETLPKWTGFISAMAVIFGGVVLVVSSVQRYITTKERGGFHHAERFALLKSIEK